MDVMIEVDREACLGLGYCVREEPDAVELDADGVATARAALPEERAIALVESCPAGALSYRPREPVPRTP